MKDKIMLHGGKTAILEDQLVYVKLKAAMPKKEVEKRFDKLGLKIFDIPSKKGKDSASNPRINEGSNGYFLEIDPKNSDFQSKRKKALDPAFEYVARVFYTKKDVRESYFAVSENSFVVEPVVDVKDESFIQLIKKLGFEIDEVKSQYLSNGFYVRRVDDKGDIFNAYEVLRENQKYVKKFHLEKIPLISPTCSLPNDPLYVNQWNLRQIDWHRDFNQCSADVIVAILDEGVDLNHPDINFSSVGINLNTMLPDGSPTGNHGTPCAGIAAGVTNNNEGLAGVSGKAKILPLAIQTWSDVEVAMGINYAAKYGAQVISMSFGVYDNWYYWSYDIIDPEIVYAHNLGVFLCAATGNENLGSISRYPSKHPLVLAVGGSNKLDKRKQVNDTSSEPFWGSSYGLEQYQNSWVGVGVVAPCLEIPATDRMGANGYSNTNYHLGFNGTSSATPQVAGLAALIKGQFPKLNNLQIRQIIEKSAEKVGGYMYNHDSRFPSSAWNQEMGYGRINARKSLELAEQLYGCNQTKNSCNCQSHQLIAISVAGQGHVSKGNPTHITFSQVITNEGGAWMNNTFIVPKKGLFYFDLNMVKDSYYHQGTQDDVMLYLIVNGTQSYGNAWSGEGDGRRGTGSFSTILSLNQNDEVKVYVRSDGNRKRHIAKYSLSIHNL